MPSKAQGLSLNAIIIAVIVLVVLIIILGLTTGYFGKWVPRFYSISSTSCADAGGKVVDKTVGCSGDDKEGTGFYDDVKEGKICCLQKSCTDKGGTCRPYSVIQYCNGAENEVGQLGELGCKSNEKCCKKV